MLQNDRIYLKPLSEEDFEFYKEIYSDPDLMEYISPVLSEQSINKSFRITLKKQKTHPRTLIAFIIFNKSNNDKIGIVGIKWNQKKLNSAELGLIIRKIYQKHSLSKDVLTLIISYVNTNLKIDNLIALCDVVHIPSNRVLKKTGFIHDDKHAKTTILKNKWIYSIVKNKI